MVSSLVTKSLKSTFKSNSSFCKVVLLGSANLSLIAFKSLQIKRFILSSEESNSFNSLIVFVKLSFSFTKVVTSVFDKRYNCIINKASACFSEKLNSFINLSLALALSLDDLIKAIT